MPKSATLSLADYVDAKLTDDARKHFLGASPNSILLDRRERTILDAVESWHIEAQNRQAAGSSLSPSEVRGLKRLANPDDGA